MPFTIRSYQYVPTYLPVTYKVDGVEVQGSIGTRSGACRRWSSNRPQWKLPAIGLLLTGLLLLASCADLRSQVAQPLGYGVVPSGETWVAVDSAYQSPTHQTVYYDPKTIRRDGDLVTVWQLTDYRWKQGGIVGRRFISAKTHKQFNCPAKHYRFLAYTDFSGHMGTGDARNGYVLVSTWFPVESDSLTHVLWEVVCSKP